MDSLPKRNVGRSSPPAPRGDAQVRPAGGAHASGSRRVAPYIKLRSLLLRYLSPILVDTVLNQAMFKRRFSEQTVTTHELQDLAPDIMLGLRMFVHERRLPELMVELAEILEVKEP